MTRVDLLEEAATALFDRPVRSAFTAAGVVLGVAALISAYGLAETAGDQIIRRFDDLAAREVIVSPQVAEDGTVKTPLPWDAEEKVAWLNGVNAAGTMLKLDTVSVSSRPNGPTAQADLIEASPGYFRATLSKLGSGRWFDHGHLARAERVAVVGRGLAERLDLATVDSLPAVFVGDAPHSVVGVLSESERAPHLLSAVVVPQRPGGRKAGAGPGSLHIDTVPGAGRLISAQAPLALAEGRRDVFEVQLPPDPVAVRAGVADDVQSLLFVLAVITLTISGLGIANITLISVVERTGEIGLRRALGAERRAIATQFLLESTAIGMTGGITGAAVGASIVSATAMAQGWAPILSPSVISGGVLAGSMIGLAAGAYPAWRAAGIEPIAALRVDQ